MNARLFSEARQFRMPGDNSSRRRSNAATEGVDVFVSKRS